MGRYTDMVGNKKLTIIARMDDSGLGHQTRNLVRLLKPDKVLAIDFEFYNGFKQHPEWYESENVKYIQGFISNEDAQSLVDETDIILTAETFYNNNLVDMALRKGVLTLDQINYEFFEQLTNRSLNLPGVILMPSHWHLDDMRRMTSEQKTQYLPPPTFVEDFNEIRDVNMTRTGKRRFLHVAGKMAAHDRAGTKDLLQALRCTNGDFELVIKVQSGEMLHTNDSRITLDYSFPEDERELYRGFDAMIQPRRYAGLNLPMNEALASGLPVIMTNIDPNNKLLPPAWLVPSQLMGQFMARTMIDVYSANPNALAATIERFATMSDDSMNDYKRIAREIADKEFSPESVLEKWAGLIDKIGL